MNKTLRIIALLLAVIVAAGDVVAGERDSLRVSTYAPVLGFGAGMVATGAVSREAYPHHYNIRSTGERSSRGTGVLEFAPLVAPWVLKAAGVATRSGWGRMAVSQGLGTAIMVGTVQGLKDGVTSWRPDGSDSHSFPSGHTAWAFMGATMAAYELGGTSGWYAFGAYTLATGIAVERVMDRHHYPTDVMAGAGIGIVSAGLGYLLGDVIFGNRQLSITGRDLRDNTNFSFLSVKTGLNLPLGHISAGGVGVERLPALSAGFRGGWAISDRWGMMAELELLSTPLILNTNPERTYVKNLSALGLIAGPTFTLPMSRRVSLTADAAVGYRKNFALKVDDNALQASPGTPVGKVDIGCVVRFAPRFSARASVGYEISHYRFTVSPSTSYLTATHATTRGTSSSLLVEISSRYEF